MLTTRTSISPKSNSIDNTVNKQSDDTRQRRQSADQTKVTEKFSSALKKADSNTSVKAGNQQSDRFQLTNTATNLFTGNALNKKIASVNKVLDAAQKNITSRSHTHMSSLRLFGPGKAMKELATFIVNAGTKPLPWDTQQKIKSIVGKYNKLFATALSRDKTYLINEAKKAGFNLTTIGQFNNERKKADARAVNSGFFNPSSPAGLRRTLPGAFQANAIDHFNRANGANRKMIIAGAIAMMTGRKKSAAFVKFQNDTTNWMKLNIDRITDFKNKSYTKSVTDSSFYMQMQFIALNSLARVSNNAKQPAGNIKWVNKEAAQIQRIIRPALVGLEIENDDHIQKKAPPPPQPGKAYVPPKFSLVPGEKVGIVPPPNRDKTGRSPGLLLENRSTNNIFLGFKAIAEYVSLFVQFLAKVLGPFFSGNPDYIDTIFYKPYTKTVTLKNMSYDQAVKASQVAVLKMRAELAGFSDRILDGGTDTAWSLYAAQDNRWRVDGGGWTALLTRTYNTAQEDYTLKVTYDPTWKNRKRHGDISSGGGLGSDLRIKQNVKVLGVYQPLGLTLYSWQYRNNDTTRYVGVMAQDLLARRDLAHAVSIAKTGEFANFYQVDYTILGMKMITEAEWDKLGLDAIVASLTA